MVLMCKYNIPGTNKKPLARNQGQNVTLKLKPLSTLVLDDAGLPSFLYSVVWDYSIGG